MDAWIPDRGGLGCRVPLSARSAKYAGTGGFENYLIFFAARREAFAEFGHERIIAPWLLEKLPPFDQGCNTDSPSPGSNIPACWTKGVQAQGIPVFGTAPTYPESPHLAIVPNNVDRRRVGISMGTSGGP